MANTLNTLLERMYEMYKISVHPSYLMPITEKHQLDGLSFFPIGDGRLKSKDDFNRNTELPQKNVMIVGSDWGTENDFNSKKISNSENTSITWKGIRDIVEQYGIANAESIFFTNAIMGLRIKDMGESSTKLLPIWKKKERINNDFYEQNIKFFKEQLKLIRPKYIIGLGIKVANFLGDVFDENDFKKAKNFSDLGIEIEVTLKKDSFNDSFTAFIIFHPSFRKLNRINNPKRAQIEDRFFLERFKL